MKRPVAIALLEFAWGWRTYFDAFLFRLAALLCPLGENGSSTTSAD
jgi:hypothetical protein